MPAPKSRESRVSTGRPNATHEAIARWLLRTVDLAIAAIIFIAPLFMGGRGPVGKLVLVSLIGIAAVAWFSRQCFVPDPKWRWISAEWLILLGGVTIAIQLVPLAPGLLNLISPAISDLLPLWQTDGNAPVHLGNWSTISLTPEDTRGGLAMYIAFALLFVVVMQRIESIDDIERLMTCLGLAAVGMASIGMLQFLFGNGNFFWIYDHPTRDTFYKVNGTFENQNHFAHFLALGTGPLIWWLHRLWCTSESKVTFTFGSKSSANPLGSMSKHALAVGLGVLVVASLLTFSRGGVIVVAIAVILTVLIYAWKALLGKKSFMGIGAFALVVCGAMAIFGGDKLSGRMGTLLSGSIQDVSKARLDLWQAHWKAIARFPVLGTGVGSHSETYPIFMAENYERNFSHGENGYFQILVEAGFFGLAIALTAFGFVLWWTIKVLVYGDPSHRCVRLAGAILPGIAASLIHSWGDFVWYIPACTTLLLVLAACAGRLFQLTAKHRESESTSSERSSERSLAYARMPKYAMVAIALVTGLICVAMAKNRMGPAMASRNWDAYRRIMLASETANSTRASMDREHLAAMEYQLEQILLNDPNDSRALLRLATIKVGRFELEQRFAVNPMRLTDIEDVCFTNKFPSKAAQDEWLDRAVGVNRRLIDTALQHCRRTIQLCPLHGDAYVYLSMLSFLDDPRATLKPRYVEQASLVRPYSGLVLFSLGSQSAVSGDEKAALQYWQRAFHCDRRVQAQMIEILGSQMPAEAFLILFQPDTTAMGRFFWYCRSADRADEARMVGEKYVAALEKDAGGENPTQAANSWQYAQEVNLWLGKIDKAVNCQRRAVELAPQDFDMHRTLASLLANTQQYAEAAELLEWCLRRHPEDDALQQELNDVRTKQAESVRTARSPPIGSRGL